MDLNETRTQTVGEVQKSQGIRLWDVLALGPYLIHLARKKELTRLDKGLMIAIGGATIIYNLNNYLKNRGKDA